MATLNPYFDHYNQQSEQNLIESLIVESIQIYGHEILYIPRNLVNEDKLYGEDVLSAFDKVFPIEIYPEDIEGFQGDGTFLSKFGIEERDEIDILVARIRFEEIVTQDMPVIPKPREGDLIYFTVEGKLFEISYVASKHVFYNLGKLYTWKMTARSHDLSGEQFNTGIHEVDDVETTFGYAIDIKTSSGFGQFMTEETVFQGDSLGDATWSARVVSWGDDVLRVNRVKGVLDASVNIEGELSGAAYAIDEIEKNITDTRHENDIYKKEFDGDLIDFSEDNPFSEKF